MKHVKKGYVLCRGYFERRDEVLGYVKFLRGNDPMHMKIGAQNLRRIYSAAVVPEAKTFEGFLQTSNLEALTQGQEVVEVTHVDEVWKLFTEVLDNSQKFDWLLMHLTDAILNAVMLVKDNENMDLLNKQIDDRALGEALILSVRKAIFDTVCSETYCMHEKDVIKLFLILRELDTQNEVLIKTIKELLSLPQKRTDFSKAELPASTVEQTSEEQGIPDVWRVSGGYSDLFKVIYRMLENTENESMRNLLQEWVTGKDVNLRFGAWIFYDYLLKDKHLKKADWSNDAKKTYKNIEEYNIYLGHSWELVRGILAINEFLPQFIPRHDFYVGDILTDQRKNLKLRSDSEMWPYALQHLETGYPDIFNLFEKCKLLLEQEQNVQGLKSATGKKTLDEIARELPHIQSVGTKEDLGTETLNNIDEKSKSIPILTKKERFKLDEQTADARNELENKLTELISKVKNGEPLSGRCNQCPKVEIGKKSEPPQDDSGAKY